jgi:putative transposase
MVFLDPGIRKFQTFYSPEGYCGYTNEEYSELMKQKYFKIDNLQSFYDNPKWKVNKYNLKNKILKLRTKVSNIVDDLHWKCSNFLCDNFKTIIIPVFKTQNIVCKKKRKITTLTARLCNSYKHYEFRQRLHHVARKKDCKVIVTTEPYTSKTCGKCGHLNMGLNGSKTFDCEKCNVSLDRDINGARNNGLAYFTFQRATIHALKKQKNKESVV